MLALSALAGYFLGRRVLRPVDQIPSTLRSINMGNLSRRLPVNHSGDEIERLTETCNVMLARLENAVDRHQSLYRRRLSRASQPGLVYPRGGRILAPQSANRRRKQGGIRGDSGGIGGRRSSFGRHADLGAGGCRLWSAGIRTGGSDGVGGGCRGQAQAVSGSQEPIRRGADRRTRMDRGRPVQSLAGSFPSCSIMQSSTRPLEAASICS